MKENRSAMVALVACLLLFVAQEALAFYNPETGRWLNRDPAGELGFTLLGEATQTVTVTGSGDESSTKPTEECRSENLSSFVGNDPVGRLDVLGLENFQFVVTSLIRPPDALSGVKTKHMVVIDEYGVKVRFAHYIASSDLIIAAPTGGGILSETIAGTHPNFSVNMTGSAWSKALGPLHTIDYNVTFDVNLCSRTGEASGSHDTYPSYVVQAPKKKIYDYTQKGNPYTGLLGAGGVKFGPIAFNF